MSDEFDRLLNLQRKLVVRGADFYRVLPPPWRVYCTCNDMDAARKIVAALNALNPGESA